MSTRFKIILATRFLGYLVFFIGLISFIFLLGPLVQAEVQYKGDRILAVKRTVPDVIMPRESAGSRSDNGSGSGSGSGPINFAAVSSTENSIIPVSTEYGIVIEKINANAKIIPGVNPANEREYVQALTQGVAEALGSTSPGQPGNLYLFSHSTDAPWNIIRFNAIFYLLRELEQGDKVIIFYHNIRYDYIVFDKSIANPNDVSFLTNRYSSPVLTLQTCDPPGTLFNRLIIRARLAGN